MCNSVADFEYTSRDLTGAEARASIERARRHEGFCVETNPWAFVRFVMNELPPADGFPFVRTQTGSPDTSPKGVPLGPSLSYYGAIDVDDVRRMLEAVERDASLQRVSAGFDFAERDRPAGSEWQPSVHFGGSVGPRLRSDGSQAGAAPIVSVGFKSGALEWKDPGARKIRMEALLSHLGIADVLQISFEWGDLKLESTDPTRWRDTQLDVGRNKKPLSRPEQKRLLEQGVGLYSASRATRFEPGLESLKLVGQELTPFSQHFAKGLWMFQADRDTVRSNFHCSFQSYAPLRRLLLPIGKVPWHVLVEGSSQYTLDDLDLLIRESEHFDIGAFTIRLPSGPTLGTRLHFDSSDRPSSFYFSFESYFDSDTREEYGTLHDELYALLVEILGGREFIE